MGKKVWLVLIFFFLISGCQHVDEEAPDYQYSVPEQLDDGIGVSSPSAEGMDAALIEEMVNDILTSMAYNRVHGLLILKNGKLVLEEYFKGWTREQRHTIQCCTKSFTSAAIGIAIDKGFIAGTGEKLSVFFPEYAHLFDDQKKKITLKNVITKTPGFSWNEHDVPYEDSSNDWHLMRAGSDPIGYVLARPVVHEPGEFWYYNSGCAYLLAGMIHQRTGMHAHEFIRIHLFEPLGISDVEWIDTHPTGLHNTAAGLHLRPRDMAKLGLLYINMGRWQERQIVSEEWVRTSTQTYSVHNDTAGYASHWWTGTLAEVDYHCAAGGFGQYIYVFSSLDLVVVFTQYYANHNDYAWRILTTYILPAAGAN